MADKFTTIDEYLRSLPDDVKVIFEKVRQTIRRAAPAAVETISYQMPTVTLSGRNLVHFAAWKHHIGLYPIPVADQDLERDLTPYRTTKDTVRLPFNRPIPYDLIERVVALLIERRMDSEEVGPGSSMR